MYHINWMMFGGIVGIVANAIMVGAIFVYAIALQAQLALVMFLTIPLFILAQRYSGKSFRSTTEALVSDWTELGSFQTEKIAGIRLIKETASERFMSQEYEMLSARASSTYRQQELETHVGTMVWNGICSSGRSWLSKEA